MNRNSRPISREDEGFFHREGYLVIPSFLKTEFNARLRTDLDQLMLDRKNKSERLLVGYPELGLLTSHPALIDILQTLMGRNFAMHHIHAVRQDAGTQGVYWHQDYEQLPQTNRSHLMVHVFYYLNGLNGEVGDLLVLPCSQDRIVARDAMMSFGTEDLPGSLCFDDLSPGSAVIVHSALWHARRPKSGGEDESRYFIDVSYCQNGVLWPTYGGMKRHTEINRTALAQGLGRNGRYDFLYDTTQFFDQEAFTENFNQTNKGSIVLQMKGISMGDQD